MTRDLLKKEVGAHASCSMEGSVEIEATVRNGETTRHSDNTKIDSNTNSVERELEEESIADDEAKTGRNKPPSGAGVESNSSAHVEEDTAVSNSNNRATSARRRVQKKVYAVSTRWEREMEESARRTEGRTDESLGQNPKQLQPYLRLTGTTEDLNSCFCCCANRIGAMFSLLEEEDGSPIVIAGPCWPFCAFVTLPLILVISLLILFFIILNGKGPIPWWLSFIYVPLLLVVLVSLFFVSCRDPGLLERVTDEEAGSSGWFWNEQVSSFRPAGAMYCRECKVLIQDYDHLCPWTGTGIGRGNILAFRVFVVAVNLLCYCSIGIVSYFLLKGILKNDP